MTLHIPRGCPLPGTSSPILPYVIVGDEAFPLKENMMQPYLWKILVSLNVFTTTDWVGHAENSFGILPARWRIYQRPIIADPNKVVLYTKAAITLHNYLRTTESSVYCPTGLVDEEDGSEMSLLVYGELNVKIQLVTLTTWTGWWKQVGTKLTCFC